MKVWHDDVRWPPSEGWEVARTNEEAQQLLTAFDVSEISLDHDLGAAPAPYTAPDDPDPDEVWIAGSGDETGLDLVKWMVKNDCVPRRVTIHSWNPAGASRMAQWLADATIFKLISNRPEVIIQPYELRT